MQQAPAHWVTVPSVHPLLGGMLLGTIFGVLVIPGLYYVFGRMADGRHMIRDEDEVPLTEDFTQGKRKKKRKLKFFKRAEENPMGEDDSLIEKKDDDA